MQQSRAGVPAGVLTARACMLYHKSCSLQAEACIRTSYSDSTATITNFNFTEHAKLFSPTEIGTASTMHAAIT